MAFLVAIEAFNILVRFLGSSSSSVVVSSKERGVGTFFLGSRPGGSSIVLVDDRLHEVFGVQFLFEDTGSGGYS